MGKAIDNLIDAARAHVTVEDIENFVMNDPGYPDYVRVWSQILKTGFIPTKNKLRGLMFVDAFALSENINMFNHFRRCSNVRFRNYQVLTSSVGLLMTSLGYPEDDISPSRCVSNLLFNAKRLRRRQILKWLEPAFIELHRGLVQHESRHAPFALLGRLLLAYMGYGSREQIAQLARQVIDDEADLRVKNLTDASESWLPLIEKYIPKKPEDEVMALLREALMESVERTGGR